MTRDARHVYQLPTSQEHVRRGQVAAVAAQLAAVLPRVRRDFRHQGGQRVGRVPLPLLQTVTCCFSALISYAQFIRPTLIHKSLFSHQLESWEGKQSQRKEENSSEITLIKYSAPPPWQPFPAACRSSPPGSSNNDGFPLGLVADCKLLLDAGEGLPLLRLTGELLRRIFIASPQLS